MKHCEIYGYRNVGYLPRDPAGDVRWYRSRAARRAALAGHRARSVALIGPSAARAAFQPIRRVVSAATLAALASSKYFSDRD